ncbi:MAG: acetyl-CoA carboxylase biotin carboxyl carrier protein [bacterium]
MEKKAIRFTDTTLRDGHQSLWATRMSFADMLPVLEQIDLVGYWSLEMWGGATFDVGLRFLQEDPWERLSAIRQRVKRTRLQMLLRGQNVVGYRNYPDDVLEEFVNRAAERGIDIFRIFDALNDARNLEKAVEFVKKAGKHAQGTLCYAVSPVHTIDYYIARAKEQREMGIDSIAIKDMAGILSPAVAFELVAALKAEVGLPVQVHCHASSGMAVGAYVKAVDAGADVIDTASAPLAFFTSQPAVETLLACFQNTPYQAELNLSALAVIAQHFEKLSGERCIPGTKAVDTMVITHQIPGGMASNLLAQLREQKAEHRLAEVLEEVPRVREDLGYPPLVTPTSQIVGVQAVMNVLAGERYKVVPKEVKDYVRGLYGRPPAPIREAIVKKVLGEEKPVKGRPADRLEPGMPRARKELSKELVEKEEDYISYALFPEVALKFFQWRKNPTRAEEPKPAPQESKPKTEPTTAVTPRSAPVPEEPGIRRLRSLLELASVHGVTELDWEMGEEKVRIKRGSAEPVVPVKVPDVKTEPVGEPLKTQESAARVEPEPPAKGSEPAPVPGTGKTEQVTSPMVGTFYSRSRPEAPPFVEKGDVVEPGQTLCIVEAMKLMNEIQAEKRCRIIDILVKDGESVEYGEPLIIIEPL